MLSMYFAVCSDSSMTVHLKITGLDVVIDCCNGNADMVL